MMHEFVLRVFYLCSAKPEASYPTGIAGAFLIKEKMMTVHRIDAQAPVDDIALHSSRRGLGVKENGARQQAVSWTRLMTLARYDIRSGRQSSGVQNSCGSPAG